MSELLNALTRSIPNTQQVTGVIQQDATGTGVYLNALSGYPESDQAQDTISRTSAGIYVLTLANFIGPSGSINVQATAVTSGAAFFTQYYVTTTGTTATITFDVFNSSAAAADCSVAFSALTY